MDQRTSAIKNIRNIIHRNDPDAEVILFGSRARGNQNDDSDWDVLVITSYEISWEIEKRIRAEVYSHELQANTPISLVITSRDEWNSSHMQITPFHHNITREGIRV